MDFSETLSLINTTAQAHSLIEELNDLLNSLYGRKSGGAKKISEHLTYPNKEIVTTLCRKNSIGDTDIVELQQVVRAYIEYVQALPAIKITLAFAPKDKDMQDIYSWFLSNVKKKVLLDVGVDSSLIGGAVIAAGGYYKDLSVARKLESLNGSKLNGQE